MVPQSSRDVVIQIATPQPVPHWALLERQLLAAQAAACEAFFARYFDERGYLLCVPRWSGDDGPDDALENLLNWTMLHALGADDRILTLFKKGMVGHFRQYTEAKTSEVPMGRDGMYYQEFHACFDWLHHGEAWSPIVLHGLSEPGDRALVRRMRRWAGMYMADDPHIPNYDPEHRVIRSFFNGSRGPLLRKATALDWAGDPIDVAGRFRAGHGETSFQEMLDHFRDYTDVVGDNPMNLGATTLGFTAYALTGEPRYRDWVLEYVDAWVEHTEANNGLIPSSVGLDGTIDSGYGWYGGVYGWGFSILQIPWRGQVAHRNSIFQRAVYGFGNALLLTGERRYVDLWRRMLDLVNANSKVEDGRTLYPHLYGRLDRLERLRQGGAIDDLPPQGPEGWYEFRPQKFAPGAQELYYWTLDRSALEFLPQQPRWIAYLDGEDPGYPVAALQADLERLRLKVGSMRADTRSPDCTMSDDPNRMNPATTDALVQLMLGGLPVGRTGYPLHCRLRYFDPARRRAGLPEDVAALVERIAENEVTVTLVNLSPVHERTVIAQGGAYAEHQITSVRAGEGGDAQAVDRSHFVVRLAPLASARLVVGMQRYANPPTLALPWV
ncbi:MAG: hypothetical protein HY332_18640 [Chloroflexi bacterium]|nr:hypothetical protein [Chloroflexota bacterium]